MPPGGVTPFVRLVSVFLRSFGADVSSGDFSPWPALRCADRVDEIAVVKPNVIYCLPNLYSIDFGWQ